MRRRRESAVEPAPEARLVPDPAAAERRLRIGDLVVDGGHAHRDAVEAAAAGAGGRIGERLVAAKVVDESIVTDALAEQLGAPVVDLRATAPSNGAHSLVSDMEAHLLDVLPLEFDGTAADVAVVDPLDPEVLSLLRRLPAREVRIRLATPAHLRLRVNQTYRALAAVTDDIEAFHTSELVGEQTASVDTITVDDDAPVVQVVNKVLTQALRDRASDVHIEPSEDCVRIRFRVDGALHEVLDMPTQMGPALVSRLKIMADMNIVERRRPQDGQFEMTVDGRTLDVRVATTATIWGEKTVLRLLDRGRSLYRLADLGMPDDVATQYSRVVKSPFGMVIVSGPTGSGKTTTLYATLSEINRPDLNVMTIEDPVEYIFPKVNQIQINEQAGLSFATGLKSILRQDPDIILVGEVRDVETARIAVQSALTGHLVLSSVHAIDAVSSMYRLLDMGIEPFLITSAVVGVVAQRLVRRICSSCRTRYEPSLQDVAMYRKLVGADKHEWWHGTGCTFCSGTGFYDRTGVYEVLAPTDELREAVVQGQPPRIARELAVEHGLTTLQTEAMRLVRDDVTTIDEVVRHVFAAEDFE